MSDAALTGMNLLRSRRGALARAATALGLSRSAPYQWHEVPADAVVRIEAATGLPRELLRPDLYRVEAAAPTQASAA
jgi:hypothetical protein